MKLLLSSSLFSLITASSVSTDRVVNPSRITFESLGRIDNDSLLVEALGTDGFVSVTNIPGFKQSKHSLMSNLHSCMMGLGDDAVAAHYFDDGTIRRSFATATLPEVGAQPIKSLEDLELLSEYCQSLQGELSSFRSSVEATTKLFSQKLSTEMGVYLQTPLMTSNVDGVVYDSISEVVAGGEHLEHFHSYQKDSFSGDAEATTIELHTDQGFFIAFTPGLIASSQDPTKQLKLSDGFYVQDRYGEKAAVKFSEEDDLVFMIGDGANQYINNNFVGSTDATPLRSTPHALSFPAQIDSSDVRVWYGLMVLPPNNALLRSSGLTHGEVREALMDASTSGDSISLGCSSQDMKAVIHTSRHLSGPSEILNCTSDELFCWYRCQPLDDELKTCADRDLSLECVDSQGQITEPAQHNGAAPACYNSTAMHTHDEEDGHDHTHDDGDDEHTHDDGDDGHTHDDGDDGHTHDEDMGTKATSTGSRNTDGNLFALSLRTSYIIISTILTVW
eukprot:CAMPEP_0201686574 /NCGR_PEP_ID=MMETSP0578-20130828/961_1 /ASSEMBLY_ACC=CAM_ASM_000663 /TAXON_ID=267565 /ORGANISM="Skeletonema grethea, Strain CCMP 1804" /LENGTH=503 /DNA_ID=CAMNT_0048170643 /DNA_START=33 /DNA_END=1544 /DNA_ORIENTATION=-